MSVTSKKDFVKEFASLAPTLKARIVEFVKFGYTMALIDVLKKDKSQETIDVALDLKKFARTGIDELYIIENLTAMTKKQKGNDEE